VGEREAAGFRERVCADLEIIHRQADKRAKAGTEVQIRKTRIQEKIPCFMLS
jgi:hypothetical protein